MALFGDSTANAGRLHDNPNVPVEALEVAGTDEVGILEAAVWALPIHYPLAQLIGHFGIDGSTTQAMLADDRAANGRSMTIQSLIACAPDLVILRGGSINDLQGVNSPATRDAAVADCVANHGEILRRMVAGGRKVLDCGIFGYGDGWLATSGTPALVRSALLQVNSTLATLANSAEFASSVRFVSPLGALHDANGKYLPGMTNDGLHLSIAGGLAQAALEAAALSAWLGPGTSRAYLGTNLMPNAGMTSVGAPGNTPTGYNGYGTNLSVGMQQVETIGGKTYFTLRANLAAGPSWAVMQLPFSLPGLTAGQVIGVEFDFFYERLSGASPSVVEFDPRHRFVWGANVADNCAGYSARVPDAAASALWGRIVFLPFKLPANGSAFNASQSLLQLRLGFESSSGSLLRLGIGDPRLVVL